MVDQQGSKENLNLSEVLLPEIIDLTERTFKNKDELFHHMTNMLINASRINNSDEFVSALYEREKIGSTYIGNCIAIPHGKGSCVVKTSAAFCRCKPFEYESCGENGEVTLVMMLAVADSTDNRQYIKILSNISRLLMKSEFVNAFKFASDPSEIISICEKEVNL